ncbi:MAG: DUF6231 family protein [Gammaproteobacteria bacterium]|nr:DUF6231 family protein [Gammaproteobacteria bacterium]
MVERDPRNLSLRLESYAPGSLLAIGPRADVWLAPFRDAHPDCPITRLDADGALSGGALLEALASHGRFDFALMAGVLERLEADDGAHLMARLRDLHTRRFAVVVDAGDAGRRWPASELIAMGLELWSSGTPEGVRVEIYGYDVGTYKVTPDWLNPRHWAHPEHWGKFRW